MTETDAADTPTKTTRAPRPRRPRKTAAAAAPTVPAGYAKARAEFEFEAQQWVRSRPDNTFRMPHDLAALTVLGVPCETCGASVYRDGDAGHTVSWKPVKSDPAKNERKHWASGITATCESTGR